jgi:diguanylate cyclase (GGDEF)-like protein
MPEFSKGEAKVLLAAVERFTHAFEADVVEVLARRFRGAQPPEVVELREHLALLAQAFTMKTKLVVVHDAQNSLLKRVIIEERRRSAEAIDAPLQSTTHPELVRHLLREIRPLEEIMKQSWFLIVPAQKAPRLTDYLSIRWADEADAASRPLLPREFDEKFHILEAPRLLLPDLAYYRRQCELRGASLAVAYVDIDDFKAINTRYTETVVDQRVLVPFLELLEAHVFGRGHAYRFGGDEYVLLHPNAGERWAVELCRDLQTKVSAKTFAGIDARLGISVGLCAIEPECMLTDREIVLRANVAKNHAKAEKKGSIASFGSASLRPDDLVLR